jgi:hypothetical protein
MEDAGSVPIGGVSSDEYPKATGENQGKSFGVGETIELDI